MIFINKKINVLRITIIFSILFLLFYFSYSVISAYTAKTEENKVPLTIIMYHSIAPKKLQTGTYIVDPDDLKSDLEWLKKNNFTAISINDLIMYNDGIKELPPKPIILSFDDGYYNNYKYAFSEIIDEKMKMCIAPIVYYTEEYTQKPSNAVTYAHATWQQLKEMNDSGSVEILNHSYNLHKQKPRLGISKLKTENLSEYENMLREDLTKADSLIKNNVGVKPEAFVYPFGTVQKEAQSTIESMGYRVTFTCEEKINYLDQNSSLYNLGRFLRKGNETTENFFKRIFKNCPDDFFS